MRKMQITYHELCSEINNLERELKRHKDEELTHRDRIVVSDLLAETVQMIRRKYQITTMYYMASEIKAADGVGPAAKDDRVEAEWDEDYTEPGWYMCSACGFKEMNRSHFCPECGKRMRVNHD